MSAPTDEQLAAWDALAAAATPGPWLSADHDIRVNTPDGESEVMNVARVYRRGPMETLAARVDAEFIAAAREGWPQCIDALRAARAMIAGHCVALDTEAAEVESLRAQLAAAETRTREIAGRAAVAMFRELRGDADSPDGHPDIWRPRIVRCVDAAMAPMASEPSAERAG